MGEPGLVPDTGDPTPPPSDVVSVLSESGGGPFPFCCASAASRFAALMAVEMSDSCSAGVEGIEDDEERRALPSSDDASKSSGGSRSFSISDLRLRPGISYWFSFDRDSTHASSKPLIASLIPSEPDASVPYGSLLEPDTLLSSDTFSDSSLPTKRGVSISTFKEQQKAPHRSKANTRAIRPTAMILFLMTFRRSTESGDVGVVGDTGDEIIATSSSSSSSSFVQVFSTATNMSVTTQACQSLVRIVDSNGS